MRGASVGNLYAQSEGHRLLLHPYGVVAINSPHDRAVRQIRRAFTHG